MLVRLEREREREREREERERESFDDAVGRGKLAATRSGKKN